MGKKQTQGLWGKKKLMVIKGKRWGDKLGVWDRYVHTAIFKTDN